MTLTTQPTLDTLHFSFIGNHCGNDLFVAVGNKTTYKIEKADALGIFVVTLWPSFGISKVLGTIAWGLGTKETTAWLEARKLCEANELDQPLTLDLLEAYANAVAADRQSNNTVTINHVQNLG